MIDLRPYQNDAIAAVADAFRRGVRRSLISLPTGTGKTMVFGTVGHRASLKGNRVLILAHTDELIQQAVDKLLKIDAGLVTQVGIVQASRNDVNHPVIVGSVQTLRRDNRLAQLKAGGPFAIVIVDEAHHAAADSYQVILRGLGCFDDNGPLTIGVTATAERADSKNLGDTWQEVVYHRDLLSMIQEGWLCDLRAVTCRLAFNANDLHVRGGDFVAAELEDVLNEAEAPRHAVGVWKAQAEGRKTLLFTPTVAMATTMADAFNDAGIPAANASLVARDQDARRKLMADFRDGKVKVLTNAQLLTEGYDEPSVECIIIARPTRSPILYRQMIGRGTRTWPGKRDCLIIDMVGATEGKNLLSLPSLFGLDAEQARAAEDRGVAGILADVEMEAARQGRVVARQVDLFNRANLNWIQADPTLWVLSLEGQSIHLELVPGTDTWDVVRYPNGRDNRPEVVQAGIDQGYAMGVAEGLARQASQADGGFSRWLVARNAGWRSQTPNEGQLDLARRLRIPFQEGITRGELSDQITVKMAQLDARRRRGR